MNTPRVLYTGLRPPGAVEGLHIAHLALLEEHPLAVAPAPLQALLDAAPCLIGCASPRGAAAVAALGLSPGPHEHRGWAVGAQSALALERALPWLTHIATPPLHAQHFRGLCAALEAHEGDIARDLLWLTVEDGPRDLAHALAHLPALRVHTIPIYATTPRAPHELDALAPLAEQADWLVVTSSRGAQALYDALGGQQPASRLVAIGPTTAATLDALGWRTALIPPTPDLDALWPLLAPRTG